MQPAFPKHLAPFHPRLCRALLIGMILTWGCAPGDAGSPVLTAEMPLHLEDNLDAATIVGSEVPADLLQPIEWRFDEPQPEWQAPAHRNPYIPQLQMTQTEDALRITLGEANRDPRGDRLHGDFYVPVPDLKRGEWGHVLVRARTSDDIRTLELEFNLGDPRLPDADGAGMFQFDGDRAPVIQDGSVQTYRLRADWSPPRYGEWEDPWQELGLVVNAGEPASLDILSISLIPKEADYAAAPAGVAAELRGREYRRTLYTHAPGRLEYRVRVPQTSRLDIGLGVLRDDAPVTFTISAQPEGEAHRLLEETYGDPSGWAQHSVDLSHLAGQTVTLVLEADAERPGTVAFWGAPTVSGARTTAKPNIIFYVIDGAGADYMSVYGYNRRTTPNLERLAAEGAVFEHAYSNSSWTRPSTASFMTSLQHSVLGGFKGGFNVVPEDAPTMAQHFHRAGYQTGVFTANPNAGRMSGLEREVDVFREGWTEFGYGDSNWKQSSSYLHEAFWTWRETYPAEPYWVHFQTVDIHTDFPAVAPFGGLFVGSEEAKTWEVTFEQLRQKPENEYAGLFEDAGVDQVGFFTVMQGLYDESMAHNDYQLGRLVERLKAEGEWENTLLIVGADHSIDAAMVDMGVFIQDSVPPDWNRPMFRPSISRVPLLFVWPGHIAGGQRFSKPIVSMIDVLPTILDLVDLPLPEVMQGQSLAPVLLGEGNVEPRPVILDEFEVDRKTGEFRGQIEVIDGRWGASLEINPDPEVPEEERRPTPLLLYDLWNDPYCLYSVHEEHPDLVEKYTVFLEAQLEAHRALGRLFTPSENVALTPEQLEALRALGYIQ